MSDDIDLDFRPVTYFGPQSLPERLIAQVKGDAVKKQLGRFIRKAGMKSL